MDTPYKICELCEENNIGCGVVLAGMTENALITQDVLSAGWNTSAVVSIYEVTLCDRKRVKRMVIGPASPNILAGSII